jgi:hypothetical protein
LCVRLFAEVEAGEFASLDVTGLGGFGLVIEPADVMSAAVTTRYSAMSKKTSRDICFRQEGVTEIIHNPRGFSIILLFAWNLSGIMTSVRTSEPYAGVR